LQTINHYDVEYKLSKSLVYPQTKQTDVGKKSDSVLPYTTTRRCLQWIIQFHRFNLVLSTLLPFL